MFLKSILVVGLLFLFSCSGSSKLAQNSESDLKEKSTNDKKETEKKTEDSDAELMGLLGDDKGEKADNNSNEKVDTELQKADNVSYESIDGKKLTTNKKEVKTDVKKEIPKEMTKSIKKDSDSKLSNLQKEIQTLKQELSQKNSSINDLQQEKNNLANENIQLKSKKSTQIIYQNSSEIISKEDYQAKYNDAYELFKAKQYDVAIQQFENLIANNASNSLSDNAQYWIGEAHFGQRKFKQAILDFEKVFTFKKSNKSEDAQFKIGYCYYILKDRNNAQIELQRFINLYPNSRNANRAEKMISSL